MPMPLPSHCTRFVWPSYARTQFVQPLARPDSMTGYRAAQRSKKGGGIKFYSDDESSSSDSDEADGDAAARKAESKKYEMDKDLLLLLRNSLPLLRVRTTVAVCYCCCCVLRLFVCCTHRLGPCCFIACCARRVATRPSSLQSLPSTFTLAAQSQCRRPTSTLGVLWCESCVAGARSSTWCCKPL